MIKKPAVVGMIWFSGVRCSAILKLQEQGPVVVRIACLPSGGGPVEQAMLQCLCSPEYGNDAGDPWRSDPAGRMVRHSPPRLFASFNGPAHISESDGHVSGGFFITYKVLCDFSRKMSEQVVHQAFVEISSPTHQG
jgi:hypothetical protein